MILAALGPLVLVAAVVPTAPSAPLEAKTAQRFADLALACVHKEYPNKISHVINSDADVQPPRGLTPAFCGCFDWHSAVHGHWLLVRLIRTFPNAPFVAPARTALAASLTPEHITAEVSYLRGAGRSDFERPYGLAWLLQLAAELREWNDPQGNAWLVALAPLEQEAAARSVAKPMWPGTAPTTRSAAVAAFATSVGWARSTLAVVIPGIPASRANAASATSYTRTLNSPPCARSRAIALPTNPAPSTATFMRPSAADCSVAHRPTLRGASIQP